MPATRAISRARVMPACPRAVSSYPAMPRRAVTVSSAGAPAGMATVASRAADWEVGAAARWARAGAWDGAREFVAACPAAGASTILAAWTGVLRPAPESRKFSTIRLPVSGPEGAGRGLPARTRSRGLAAIAGASAEGCA